MWSVINASALAGDSDTLDELALIFLHLHIGTHIEKSRTELIYTPLPKLIILSCCAVLVYFIQTPAWLPFCVLNDMM